MSKLNSVNSPWTRYFQLGNASWYVPSILRPGFWSIGIITFVVMALISPRVMMSDSCYTLLVGHQLLTKGTWTVDEYLTPAEARDYQISTVNGHYVHTYPPGNTVLAVPFVAASHLVGYPPFDDQGHYSRRRETRVQMISASVVVALTMGFLYLACRELIGVQASFALCLAMGFGSSLWSTSSRSLWTHTFTGLILALSLWVCTSGHRSRWLRSPFVFATLLSWLFFLRPSNAPFIVVFSIYYFFSEPNLKWSTRLIKGSLLALSGLTWLGLFIGWSLSVWGAPLPGYYLMGASMHLDGWLDRMAGLFLSPSRGLLIYSPLFLGVIYLVLRTTPHLVHNGLAWVCVTCIGIHVMLISTWGMWWGGHAFGPRLLVEVVPFATVLTAIAIATLARERQPATAGQVKSPPVTLTWQQRFGLRPWELRSALALVVVSIAMHGIGTFSKQAMVWNARRDIDKHPEALWDWNDSPITSAFHVPS